MKARPSIDAMIVQMAKLKVEPCNLCFDQCCPKPFKCIIGDDLQVLLEAMKLADGIIIACPFYFYIPSRFQPSLERTSYTDYFTEEKHGRGNDEDASTLRQLRLSRLDPPHHQSFHLSIQQAIAGGPPMVGLKPYL